MLSSEHHSSRDHLKPSDVPASFAIPHLQKTNGYSVIVTSLGANLRIPFASDYCVSKHALIRFVEFIVLGMSKVFFFARMKIISLATSYPSSQNILTSRLSLSILALF